MNNADMPNLHELFGEHQSQVPPHLHSAQPPQLNAGIRNHTDGCEFGENKCAGSNESSDSNGLHDGANRTLDNVEGWELIFKETDADQGEEGLAPYQMEASIPGQQQLEIPGHGFITFVDIFQALARHENCTCHGGASSDDYMSESATAFFPDLPSPGSMVVELGSGERSLEASGYFSPGASSLFSCSASAGTLARLVGAAFDVAFPPTTVYHFRGHPLRLTPEEPRRRDAPMEYSYPSELEMSEDESSDDET